MLVSSGLPHLPAPPHSFLFLVQFSSYSMHLLYSMHAVPVFAGFSPHLILSRPRALTGNVWMTVPDS